MSQFNTLNPYLGEVAAFTINSPDLEASLHFYEKLGFRETMRSDFPFPFIQVTDDAILIMLRQSNDPYLALTYYRSDFGKIVEELEAKGVAFVSKPKKGDPVNRYLFQSPDGANISLVETPAGFSRPPGNTMLTMEQADYLKPGTYTNQTAGMFGEYAESVADLDISVSFWEKSGFTVLSRFESPKPWAILSDGLSIVGLHQGNEFSAATITFFAADMKEKLEKLKAKGLAVKDLGHGNGILDTPEKQKIFLFNMGM